MYKFCLMLLCCFTLFKANGQAGSLDSSFGVNGVQTTSILSNANLLGEEGRVALTDAGGDIYVVVLVDHFTIVARYLPNGKLDLSYGNAGYTNAFNLYVTGAAFQDDRIIVAGFTNNPANGTYDFALARYSEAGMLDSSFGDNGKVMTDFDSSNDAATSIAVYGDKIIVAGYTIKDFTSDFALARYTADGALDASFGENGRVTTDFYSLTDFAYSVTYQGDKILVGGNTDNSVSGNEDFALARYTADGMLDSSFGENGKVTTDFNFSDDVANAITIQGDKIIIAGSTRNADFTSDFALARYTADGVLDSAFGVNGKVITDFNNSDDVADAITLQGKNIIMAGYTRNNSNSDFVVTRYTKDGVLDASFGENGKVITDIGGSSNDGANSIALQNYKIVAAGYTFNAVNSNYDYALTRYTADGKLDFSFGEKGLLTGHFTSSQTFFTSTVIQGNKVVASGYALNDNNSNDFAIARYTVEGILDSSFGINGLVITDINSSDDVAHSTTLQGDKIIVGGSTYDAVFFNNNFALARYTKDGILDSSFGVNGIVTTDFNNSDDIAYSVTLQGNKILLAGYTYNLVNFNYDFAIARYTADGRLDNSFGDNGKLTTDFNSTDDVANSITLQGDKIIVAGYTYNPVNFNNDFALTRYTADGVPDASFGENGQVTTDFDSRDEFANSMAIQEDKIVVAGYTFNPSDGTQDFVLARYTKDGSLDPSFGENGHVITAFNGNPTNVATSIALQEHKIIAGGYTTNSSNVSYFALARYEGNGALDSTFGENGSVMTDLGDNPRLQAIALHQNRLYAAGSIALEAVGTSGVVAAYQLEVPEPSISITGVRVSESKRFAVVSVHLSKPANRLVRVHFTTSDKTALHNQDYYPISGPLFFIPGINNIAKIFIPIIDDNKTEGDEQFEILLKDALHASIKDSIGVVTIVDDDTLPVTKQTSSFYINASPNPFQDAFAIKLKGSNYKQLVRVRVYDVSGRIIEEKSNVYIGQSLRLGDRYKPGTYIIDAQQGSQRVQTKVIKIDR